MSRYLPRVNTPLSSGGGGGQTQDHQAPVIIVGNATSGDTAFVCDILDPGDGTGIQAVLVAAGKRSAIWLRSGIYDLNLGGVVSPMVVPSGVTILGASSSSVEVVGRNSGAIGVFDLGTSAELRNIGITSQIPTGAVSGIYLVRLGTGARIVDCVVSAATSGQTSLKSAIEMNGDTSVVDNCNVLVAGQNSSTCIGALADGQRVDGCYLFSDNIAINASGAGLVVANVTGQGGRFLQASLSDRMSLSNVSWDVSVPIGVPPGGTNCVSLDDSSLVSMTGLVLDNPSGIIERGIYLGGPGAPPDESRAIVSACALRRFDTGIFVDTNQQNDLLVSNSIQGAVTPIDDNGAGTNAAQNIF